MTLCVGIETSDGLFVAHYSGRGLAALDFPPQGALAPVLSGEGPEPVMQWHQLTSQAVRAILAGKEMGEAPPLDFEFHSTFRRSVWDLLRKIRPGQTMSYGEVAARLGRPGAARAVGAACGANPIPLIIPCHRVVGSAGRLGGFSGGARWKEMLLAREGVRLL
jgi:O-6-methylguanine DNA methyltransferase